MHSFVITKAFEAMSYLPHAPRVALSVSAAIQAFLVSYEFIEAPARRFLRPREAA